ncbi:MAG: hypothetical protein ACPLXB_00565 [Minisyncoccia bacterium]
MKIISKKRLAEAQSKPKENPGSDIPILSKKDNFENQLEKAVKDFLIVANYVPPVCLGFRNAFPDGDSICEKCPRYNHSPTIENEIKNFTKFLIEKGLSEIEAQEYALKKISCRYASDKRIREHNLELIQKQKDIEKNFENDPNLKLRLEKTLEPLKQKYERENREKIKERQEKIKELMKGG